VLTGKGEAAKEAAAVLPRLLRAADGRLPQAAAAGRRKVQAVKHAAATAAAAAGRLACRPAAHGCRWHALRRWGWLRLGSPEKICIRQERSYLRRRG